MFCDAASHRLDTEALPVVDVVKEALDRAVGSTDELEHVLAAQNVNCIAAGADFGEGQLEVVCVLLRTLPVIHPLFVCVCVLLAPNV